MTKVVIESNGAFRIGDNERFTIHDKLPPVVYQTQVDIFGNIFLTKSDDFKIKHKIYGSTDDRVQRIMATFNSRNNSTGVLLAGDKGSGKTMLAKKLAEVANAQGIAVIISTVDATRNPGYVDFISELKFPVMIILDEFEKMFEDTEQQNSLLTLFDGLYTAKRLFVLTVNEPRRVNNFFHARPGRIFYRFNYAGVEPEAVEEMCVDNNVDPTFCDNLRVYHQMNPYLSFDSLNAIIEEYTRFGYDFKETISGLNISDISERIDRAKTWDISVYYTKIKKKIVYSRDVTIDSFEGQYVNLFVEQKTEDDNDTDITNQYIVEACYPASAEINKLPLAERKYVLEIMDDQPDYRIKNANFLENHPEHGFVFKTHNDDILIMCKEVYAFPQQTIYDY